MDAVEFRIEPVVNGLHHVEVMDVADTGDFNHRIGDGGVHVQGWSRGVAIEQQKRIVLAAACSIKEIEGASEISFAAKIERCRERALRLDKKTNSLVLNFTHLPQSPEDGTASLQWLLTAY